MSLLPDIEEGKIKELPIETKQPIYQPPRFNSRQAALEEDNLRELNNHGREEVAEDFSDSKKLQ